MAAMMLPSEFRSFGSTTRPRGRWLQTVVLAAGYLAVWLARRRRRSGSPTCSSAGASLGMHSRLATAVVLGAAALYQLTPLKRRCLRVCRAPLARILHGWRDGLGGAFRMGVDERGSGASAAASA